jgi:ribonuclease BN (tRNA processing enzyme)
MSAVKVQILGCGDAFSSGGRLQSCYWLEWTGGRLLTDCGATALVGIRRAGLDPAALDGIVLTHLHGDHFAGVPFLLLQQHYVAKRTRPLVIAGPEGAEGRVHQALAALFPGSETLSWRFPLRFEVLAPSIKREVIGLHVEPFLMVHPSGAPSLGLRLEIGGRTIAFSGDTEWNDALVSLAKDADLFVCECYAAEPGTRYHLDLQTLAQHRGDLGCKRLLLTHLGEAALAVRADFDAEVAEDGMVLRI